MSTVLITGASRGIGAATARLFAQQGWDVAVNYNQSEEAARELVRELTALDVRACAIQADVSDPVQARALVEQTVCQLGGLDVLVCNAGIALPQQLLTDTTDEQWRAVFAANVDGMFYTVRAATPHFVREKAGRIITLSSMWGDGRLLRGGLFRGQRGGDRHDEGPGQGTGALRHHRQLCGPRSHRHGHERPSGRGQCAGPAAGDTAGARGHTGGRGPKHFLPCRPRRGLCHRTGAPAQRRHLYLNSLRPKHLRLRAILFAKIKNTNAK